MLLLQATFATADGAAQFWDAAVPLMALLGEAPGFIRRFSFPDGPTINLWALWKTVEDGLFKTPSAPIEALVASRKSVTNTSRGSDS